MNPDEQGNSAHQAQRKLPDNHRNMAWVLLQKYGLVGSLRVLWRDVAWDYFHRVDTAKPVSNTELFNKADAVERNRYVATTFEAFDSALGYLAPRVNFSDGNFVDVGSGKGKVLIAASQYPFRRVKGLEASAVLNEIALRNLTTLGLEATVTATCGDAADIIVDEDDLVFYLFNPFTGAVLEECLQRIANASRERKRYLVYVNPTEHAVYQRYFKLMDTRIFQPGNVEINFYETP